MYGGTHGGGLAFPSEVLNLCLKLLHPGFPQGLAYALPSSSLPSGGGGGRFPGVERNLVGWWNFHPRPASPPPCKGTCGVGMMRGQPPASPGRKRRAKKATSQMKGVGSQSVSGPTPLPPFRSIECSRLLRGKNSDSGPHEGCRDKPLATLNEPNPPPPSPPPADAHPCRVGWRRKKLFGKSLLREKNGRTHPNPGWGGHRP